MTREEDHRDVLGSSLLLYPVQPVEYVVLGGTSVCEHFGLYASIQGTALVE